MFQWKLVGLGILVASTIIAWAALAKEIQSAGSTMITGISHVASSGIPFIAPSPTATPPAPFLTGDSLAWAILIGTTIVGVCAGLGSAVITGRFQARSEARRIEALEGDKAALGNDKALLQAEVSTLRSRYESPAMTPEEYQEYEGYAQAYVQAMFTDPDIMQIQVLDMPKAVDTTTIYTGTKLLAGISTTLPHELPKEIDTAQKQRSLDALLQAEQQLFEKQINSAQDWHTAIAISASSKHFVLLGGPGAGKTIILKYLVLKFRDYHLPELPIYINLGDFIQSPYFRTPDPNLKQNSLIAFAAGMVTKKLQGNVNFHHQEAYKYLAKRAKVGQVLFLLDALEQTALDNSADAATNYNKVIQAIKQLRSDYKESPIIMAARKAAYQHRQDETMKLIGFNVLELLDLSTAQMKLFIDTWLANMQQQHIANLNLRLEQNMRIHALAVVPLFLAEIATLTGNHQMSDISKECILLYKLCISILLRKWESNRYPSSDVDITPDDKWLLLQKLAWCLHREGHCYFRKDDLRYGELRSIADTVQDNKLLLNRIDVMSAIDELVVKNGLLKRVSEDEYSFSYLGLQEYCAAEYAVKKNLLDELLNNCSDPWWEEVILLYAGSVSDPKILLGRLLSASTSPSNDRFYTSLILAGRCLATYISTNNRPKQKLTEVITALSNHLVTTPYTLAQEQIADVLMALCATIEDITLLEQRLLPYIDTDLRPEITAAISTAEKRPITLYLLPLVANSSISSDVRKRIAETLTEPNTSSVITKLVDLLDEQTIEANVRMRIADIIGLHGEPSAADALLDQLAKIAIGSEVRWSIAAAIGRLGNTSQQIVQRLDKICADNTTDLHVRWSIMNILSILNASSDSAVLRLKQLFTEEQLDQETRESILRALELPDEQAVTTKLLEQLRNTQLHCLVRKRLAYALIQLAEDRSLYEDLDDFLKGTFQALDALLQDKAFSDIEDSIYRAMWAVNRRIK